MKIVSHDFGCPISSVQDYRGIYDALCTVWPADTRPFTNNKGFGARNMAQTRQQGGRWWHKRKERSTSTWRKNRGRCGNAERNLKQTSDLNIPPPAWRSLWSWYDVDCCIFILFIQINCDGIPKIILPTLRCGHSLTVASPSSVA